jgi:galactokinase
MHQYVHDISLIAKDADAAIESGDIIKLASSMNAAQTSFDRNAMPNCPSQLTSPLLHSLMQDSTINMLSLAVKGVGSQGDGSAQMLCKSAEDQSKLLEYIKEKYHMDGFLLTIPISSI